MAHPQVVSLDVKKTNALYFAVKVPDPPTPSLTDAGDAKLQADASGRGMQSLIAQPRAV
jgi:hypothetical protein